MSLSDADFVKQAYVILLGRNCDPQGEAFYHAQLVGGTSRLKLLADLRRSTESRAARPVLAIDRLLELQRLCGFPIVGWRAQAQLKRETRRVADLPLFPASEPGTLGHLLSLPDEEFIREAYLILLGRDVDPHGKSHYIEHLARHNSRIRVLADLRHGQESQAAHPTLAVDAFLKAHAGRALPLVGRLGAARLREIAAASSLPLPASKRRVRTFAASSGTEKQARMNEGLAAQPAAPDPASDPNPGLTQSVVDLEVRIGARLSAIQLGIDVMRGEHSSSANGDAIVARIESALERLVSDRLEGTLVRVDNAVDELKQMASASSVQTRLNTFELHLGNLINAQIELQSALRARMDDALSLLRGAVRPEDIASLRDRLDSLVQADRDQVAVSQAIIGNTADLLALVRAGEEQSTAIYAQLDSAVVNGLARIERNASGQLLVLKDQVLVTTDDGFVVIPDDDPVLVVAIRHMNGILEPGTVSVIRQLLDVGDTMIDVGAHIGLITLIAARKVGKTGRIIAIEPVTRSANALETMLSLNSFENRVQLNRCAAGKTSGRAQINVGRILGHSSLLPLDSASTSAMVDVRPIDDMVPPGTAVKLVKLDVEGFELECLEGMARLLRDNPNIGLVAEFGPSHLERAGHSISEWFGAFQKLGFEGWEIDEENGRLSVPRSPRELATVHSINLLFWRGDRRMLAGLEKSVDG